MSFDAVRHDLTFEGNEIEFYEPVAPITVTLDCDAPPSAPDDDAGVEAIDGGDDAGALTIDGGLVAEQPPKPVRKKNGCSVTALGSTAPNAASLTCMLVLALSIVARRCTNMVVSRRRP